MQDADLRRALRPIDPDEGFADGVMARIRREQADDASPAPAKPAVRARAWVAASLAVAASLVIAVGVAREESARRDAEARRAAENLEVALQITGSTLQHVQMKVNHIGADHDESH
jgi:hypothetical protein